MTYVDVPDAAPRRLMDATAGLQVVHVAIVVGTLARTVSVQLES